MKRYEHYMWLRWLRLPLTIHVEPLRLTAGLAAHKCVDGSGEHSHCYRVEIVLPVLRFVTVLRWGPRPISPGFSAASLGGFGNIGGKSLTERQRAIEKFDYDDELEEV